LAAIYSWVSSGPSVVDTLLNNLKDKDPLIRVAAINLGNV
jgi:HEAT repeat protein